MSISRKYIGVEYDEITQYRLRNWCYNNGFDIEHSYSGKNINPLNFRFHTTLIYSVNQLSFKNQVIYFNKSHSVIANDLIYITDNIPVIKIESNYLRDTIKHYENLGAQHSYDDNLMHISLSYYTNKDISHIQLPDFNLLFNKLYIEDIDE